MMEMMEMREEVGILVQEVRMLVQQVGMLVRQVEMLMQTRSGSHVPYYGSYGRCNIFDYPSPQMPYQCLCMQINNIHQIRYIQTTKFLDQLEEIKLQWVREEDLAKDLKLHSKQLVGLCVFLKKKNLSLGIIGKRQGCKDI
ncbi:hypothetical protein Dsin_005484 [Dipteronia sinensis]|uniref:Uncharacterized protein n=1 Tax=Dipteronia sinensis TaxID=43782 RepID=A0AAE0EF94_9ROSI|nr:hypothetical protein Dsin_005484 [Dipteronia sinensis]